MNPDSAPRMGLYQELYRGNAMADHESATVCRSLRELERGGGFLTPVLRPGLYAVIRYADFPAVTRLE